MARRDHVLFVIVVSVLIGAVIPGASADPMTTDVADTSERYLAARDGLDVIEGTEALLSGGRSQLVGKVIEVAGKVAGRSSNSAGEKAAVSFMLKVGEEETIFVDAPAGLAPVRVGNRIQALIEFPAAANPLDHFVLREIAYPSDLPSDIRLVTPGRKPESAVPEDDAADDEANEEDDEAVDAGETSSNAETVETASEKPEVQRTPRPGTEYPEFEQIWPEQDEVEVWMGWIGKQNSKLSEMEQRIIAESVLYYADHYEVDHRLVFAMIKAESSFSPRCKSHAGAMGLTQLMPGTAKYLGVSNPWDMQQNIMGGVRYLAEQLALYEDRSAYEQCVLALAAYNAGPNAVKRAGGIPDNGETPKYCQKVAELFYKLWKDGMP